MVAVPAGTALAGLTVRDPHALVLCGRGYAFTCRPSADDPLARCPRPRPVVIDIDGTPVAALSEQQGAQRTFERGFGFSPILACVDHGEGGTGACLAGLL